MFAITTKTKIIDIINEDHTVLAILLRLNVLPGYGEKTLSQIAEENKIDVNFLINILQVYLYPEFSSFKALVNSNICFVTLFLRKSHEFYKNVKIPELKKLFSQIIEHSVVKKNIVIIEHYFNRYLEEFFVHMDYEEKQVFPFAEELNKILETHSASETFLQGLKNFSISKYLEQHEDNTQEKLEDLKNILIKFIPELSTYTSYYQFISNLYRLDRDLSNHINIENEVLVPKIDLMIEYIYKLLKENKIKIMQP